MHIVFHVKTGFHRWNFEHGFSNPLGPVLVRIVCPSKVEEFQQLCLLLDPTLEDCVPRRSQRICIYMFPKKYFIYRINTFLHRESSSQQVMSYYRCTIRNLPKGVCYLDNCIKHITDVIVGKCVDFEWTGPLCLKETSGFEILGWLQASIFLGLACYTHAGNSQRTQCQIGSETPV